jgi:DNA-binding transcriptional MerR regulator
MKPKTTDGQITIYEDPRLADVGLPIEVIETILAELLSGSSMKEISKNLSLPMDEIERTREEYAKSTLRDIRTWYSLAFLKKTSELVFKALNQIETTLSEAEAKDAAVILTKLHDRQLLIQGQLETMTESEVQGSEEEIRARIQKIEDSLKKERMFDKAEDAQFEEEIDVKSE